MLALNNLWLFTVIIKLEQVLSWDSSYFHFLVTPNKLIKKWQIEMLKNGGVF